MKYMKKLCIPAWFCLTAMFFSCAAFPPARETPPEAMPPAQASAAATPVETRPERPVKPQVPEYIMGKGMVQSNDRAAFLLRTNPRADRNFVETLAVIYTQEAAAEGVNHDVAFAQMCLETGFLGFGGDVKPEQNNFAGMGAIGNGEPGLTFPDPRTGVRAHIQHLKAYASTEPLNQELVNPRFRFVRRGSAPAIKGLAGTWAADRSYAEKINNILERLYGFSFD